MILVIAFRVSMSSKITSQVTEPTLGHMDINSENKWSLGKLLVCSNLACLEIKDGRKQCD